MDWSPDTLERRIVGMERDRFKIRDPSSWSVLSHAIGGCLFKRNIAHRDRKEENLVRPQ